MDLMEAIRNRRSIGKVKPDPVDRVLIEQLLEAAAFAPNHFMTQPWRFFVMTGEGRRKLGDAYAAIAAEKRQSEGQSSDAELLQSEVNKAFRAPVVIAVAASCSDEARVHRVEELAAVHAAVQNMLLTAHALGLGAIWRTGDAAYHPLMKSAFELGEQDAIVGFIYIGYPDIDKSPPPRDPYSTKTVWITE